MLRAPTHKLSVLLLLPLLLGCVNALGGEYHVSGAELPQPLPQLSLGTPQHQVVALLGPPSSQAPAGSDTLLTWTEIIRPRGCRTYFLGIPLNREPRATRQVLVTIREGLLHQATAKTTDRYGEVLREASQTPFSSIRD